MVANTLMLHTWRALESHLSCRGFSLSISLSDLVLVSTPYADGVSVIIDLFFQGGADNLIYKHGLRTILFFMLVS